MDADLMDTVDANDEHVDFEEHQTQSPASWGRQLPRIALGDGGYLTVPAPRDE